MLHAAWALATIAGLAAARACDPYVYGFTAMGLAPLTGGLALAALVAMAAGSGGSWWRRLAVLAALALAGVVIRAAFAELATYNWA